VDSSGISFSRFSQISPSVCNYNKQPLSRESANRNCKARTTSRGDKSPDLGRYWNLAGNSLTSEVKECWVS